MSTSPTPEPRDIVAEAELLLKEAALDAVQALQTIARSGEDGPRVKAATEILDRIGVTSKKPTETSVQFPPELLLGMVSGISAMFGVQLRPEALQAMRRVAPMQIPEATPLVLQPEPGKKKKTRKAHEPKTHEPPPLPLSLLKKAQREDADD